MGDFDLVQRNNEERRLRELHQSVRSRLNEHIRSIRHSVETNLPERNVDVNALVFACIGYLLGKGLEFPVQCSSAAPLFLLRLEFFFIAVTMLAPTVAGLIELHIRSLAIELDILGLSLTDHDRRLQMNMDNNDHLVSTRLEEQMLHVAEKDINMLIPEWRLVAETVLMDFNLPWHTLAIKRRPEVDIRELNGPAICS